MLANMYGMEVKEKQLCPLIQCSVSKRTSTSRFNLALLIHICPYAFFVFEVFSLLCAMFCVAGTALLSTNWLKYVMCLTGCWLTQELQRKGYLDLMTKMARVQIDCENEE